MSPDEIPGWFVAITIVTWLTVEAIHALRAARR